MLVHTSSFSDAALVLLGHGTTLNADSCAPIYRHAQALREQRLFAEVREAFWKQEPRLAAVLSEVRSPRVFLAPLFISEGYFSETVIPDALGLDRAGEGVNRVQRRGSQTLYYCRPVGTHATMTDVLLGCARDVVESAPFPCVPKPEDTTLFVAGHGTEQSGRSRQAIDAQVEHLRALRLYADVRAVFLEEAPRIGDCYQLAATRNIVLVPFFISDGLHVQEDIPVLLGEPERVVQKRLALKQPPWRNPTEKQGKLVWYSSSVGGDPRMADVVLERVREALSWEAGA